MLLTFRLPLMLVYLSVGRLLLKVAPHIATGYGAHYGG